MHNQIFFNIRSMRWDSLHPELSDAIANIYTDQPALLSLSSLFPAGALEILKSLLLRTGLTQPT